MSPFPIQYDLQLYILTPDVSRRLCARSISSMFLWLIRAVIILAVGNPSVVVCTLNVTIIIGQHMGVYNGNLIHVALGFTGLSAVKRTARSLL